LATKLGVEAGEMGVSASHTSDENGVRRWSILIFDKAPGGAGFSVAAADHIDDLLRAAAEILDCPRKAACVRGCPECIMCRDMESLEEKIDRICALDLARRVVVRLALPTAMAILGPGTRFEFRPLSDAVVREMGACPNSELRFWLNRAVENSDLAKWPLLMAAQRLASRGRSVQMVASSELLNSLDLSARFELYGAAMKSGCKLSCGPAVEPTPGVNVVAWVGEHDDGLAWAEDFRTDESALFVGPMAIPGSLAEIDPETFLRQPERTAVVEITASLNGRIEDFGRAFWEILASRSHALDERLRLGKVPTSVEYVDRYLNSPLPVRLMREVLKSLLGIEAVQLIRIETADALSCSFASSPVLISHDWRLVDQRNQVVTTILARDFPNRAVLEVRPKRHLPHGRCMRIRFDDGSIVVRLDQGFGYWATMGSIPFPFSGSLIKQADDLLRADFKVRAFSSHPTYLAINEET
jgi:hypothetical protein